MTLAVDDIEQLDPGIRPMVDLLLSHGIETFESCQGGEDHAYPVPTIRFHGDRSEGFRCRAIVLRSKLQVAALRRIWPVIDGEPTGPWWELTFREPTTERSVTT